MKKHIDPFKFFAILAFLLAPFLIRASGPPADGDNVEKKKTISKSYTVASGDKLSIENSFGDVLVNTWDKNEIQVDIVIGVNAPTDEKAQKMLDDIRVDEGRNGNDIHFKTGIGNMGKGIKNKVSDDQRRFFIDYKISMPSGNGLSIENSFGKINIGNFAGPVSLTSKFGALTTGELADAKNLHVEFGKADIGAVTNPDVVFKFNSRSQIKNISGTAKVHVEFSNNVEFTVDNSIKDLSIFESYSNLRLNVPENLTASIQVHTNFGSFNNSSRIDVSEEKEDENSGPKFDRDYSGNSGSGGGKIKIKSSFGKIHLALAGDESERDEGSVDDGDKNNDQHKDKNKDKHKDKNKDKQKNKDKGDKDDDDDGNVNL